MMTALEVCTRYHYDENPLPEACAAALHTYTQGRNAVLAQDFDDPFDLRWGEARSALAQHENEQEPYESWKLYAEGDTVEVWFVECYVGRPTWAAIRLQLVGEHATQH